MRLRELIILAALTLLLGLLCSFGVLSAWLALGMMALAAGILSWFAQDQLRQNMKSKEQTLQTQLRISDKDASLKGQQIMTILTNIPSPLAMMDSYGHLLLYNEGFSRFLSEETEEPLTYRDKRIDGEIALFLKEAYLSESAMVRNIHFNGIDFQCLSVPIQEKGRFTGCLLLFQDITQAMEKERMQKRFIADASHELKTPIAAIKGMIEILNRDDFDDEPTMKEFHRQIQKETQRLENIVADLLQLSRLSMNRMLLDRQPCQVSELFENLISEVRHEARQRQVQLEVDVQVNRPFSLDAQKMHQALANLVTNALYHSGATIIRLSAYMQKGRLMLAVSDNGCGIDQKHIDRIFERFYRVEPSRSRANGGSGLGLAIVRAIVNAHEGEIEVTSELGKGTRFCISLPDRS